MVSPADTTRFAARRVLIRLPRDRAFDPGWRAAADDLLIWTSPVKSLRLRRCGVDGPSLGSPGPGSEAVLDGRSS